MRVICPHCQKTITLADSVAGQATQCPECKNTLTAPTLMAPDTAVFAPPVAPAAAAPAPPIAATSPAPSNESGHSFRLALSANVLRWIGPAALVVLFLATFFTWVGSYSGSYAIYTQTAWGAGFGTFSTDPVGDEVMKAESDLRLVANASPAMIFALLFLLVVMPIALLDLAKDHFQFSIPDAMQVVWPHRLMVALVGSGLIYVLLTLQLLGGIGLENTAAAMADKRVTPAAPESTEPSTKVATERELRRGIEINRLGLKRKGGLCVGYWASLIAVAGFGLEMWMQRRGNRRPPAIELQW